MPHVHVIPYEESTGIVRREYQKGYLRADRLWNIVSIQSQLPEVMRDSMRLYGSVMFGESPLSRWQREFLAVVTSQINECEY